MRLFLLAFTLTLSVPAVSLGQIPAWPNETFSARAEALAAGGVAATALTIHVERYTTDAERRAEITALETGGPSGLTAALRRTPSIGYVQIGPRRWAIRHARQESTLEGRRIVIVLDQPVFFLGGGELNPKPRDGFELAVIQFELDATGSGQGTMAAAARIGRGGTSEVELTDYSDEPIVLVAVAKITS